MDRATNLLGYEGTWLHMSPPLHPLHVEDNVIVRRNHVEASRATNRVDHNLNSQNIEGNIEI